MRLRERRGVVDAVARHRDKAAFVLEALDRRGFLARQYLGDDVLDAEPSRDRIRRPMAVAG